jgi:hypothetical protein
MGSIAKIDTQLIPVSNNPKKLRARLSQLNKRLKMGRTEADRCYDRYTRATEKLVKLQTDIAVVEALLGDQEARGPGKSEADV